MRTNDYPILEYDPERAAVIEPEKLGLKPFSCDKLVITFFPEVIGELLKEELLETETVISGENPVTVYRWKNDDVMLTLGQIGCPACAGNLDVFQAMGAKKVLFCGGGGALDNSLCVGRVLLVDSAIRDEGFSYHYAPPARYIDADPAVNARIAEYLDKKGVPYLRGRVWTTDALFRETHERIARRREEGAQIVEMEQAGCLAVAACRGFSYGALIYAGDDVSGADWDTRSWRHRGNIRADLVDLCRELTHAIE